MTYSLAGYAAMVGDNVRTAAYSAALRATVKPGQTVVDIGTGTGYFAVLACKLGASRVYAIEPDPAAIAVARETALINAVRDRITFLECLSTEVTLPEPADVIVSDLRGVLPLHTHHIRSIADARDRLLRPGGTLIPLQDEIFAAPVWAPSVYRKHCEPWSRSNIEVDVTNWGRYSRNSWTKTRVDPTSLIEPAASLGILDYRTIATPAFRGEVSWNARRASELNGFVVWFDARLADGIGFSCAPDADEAIYGSAFFPLPEAVSVEVADRITFSLKADLVHGEYVWRWSTGLVGSGAGGGRRFDQSTFFCQPLDSKLFARARPESAPHLRDVGEMTAAALQMMDGTRTLSAIADALRDRFPHKLGDPDAFSNFVADVSVRFGA